MIRKLKMIKANRKLSIYDLSLEIGTSASLVDKFLKGQRNIRPANMLKIYNYINKVLTIG